MFEQPNLNSKTLAEMNSARKQWQISGVLQLWIWMFEQLNFHSKMLAEIISARKQRQISGVLQPWILAIARTTKYYATLAFNNISLTVPCSRLNKLIHMGNNIWPWELWWMIMILDLTCDISTSFSSEKCVSLVNFRKLCLFLYR